MIAIISASVGGIFTYVFEKNKERKQDKKDQKIKLEELQINRPEFIILEMEDSFSKPGKCITNRTCNTEIFVVGFKEVTVQNENVTAIYDKEYLEKKSWVYKQYTLKNIGKTPVYELNIISNFKRSICICDVEVQEEFIKMGLLNYSVIYDKRIGPNETFTLKIYYHKEKVISGTFSAIFSIGMRDNNGKYWIQPFFAPEDKLYESHIIEYNEYRDDVLPNVAIECFKNPYLW